MILVFLGPPGSGKGTQAKKLADKFNLPHIALGDILRQVIREGTDLGARAKQFVEAGKLVPDEVTIEITRQRIAKPDCKNGFILDGFPRSPKQAEALDKLLEKKDFKVVYFSVPMEVVIERNSGRRSCPECAAVYHVKFNAPKIESRCDRCGTQLYQRKDDTAEVIRTRFEVYSKNTAPLVEYYKKKNKLVEVEARGQIDEVFLELTRVLGV